MPWSDVLNRVDSLAIERIELRTRALRALQALDHHLIAAHEWPQSVVNVSLGWGRTFDKFSRWSATVSVQVDIRSLNIAPHFNLPVEIEFNRKSGSPCDWEEGFVYLTLPDASDTFIQQGGVESACAALESTLRDKVVKYIREGARTQEGGASRYIQLSAVDLP
jgi:hypothetical protein